MDEDQQQRFRKAVDDKNATAAAQSTQGAEHPHSGEGAVTETPEQAARMEAGRTPDGRSIRDKSSGKGKMTADKWNQ